MWQQHYTRAIKWDSLIRLIMFRAATLSKRSFIEEAVKCLLRELINAGHSISTDQRNRLAAERAEMIIFVKHNLPAINFDY